MRGAIVAGGLASRFEGKPKGLEKVGGERILDRVAAGMTIACDNPPLIVANSSDAHEWRGDLHVVPDVMPGCGSIGGIYTALLSGEGPVLVTAWDMPFIPPTLLERLVQESDGFDVFLPETTGERGLEPFCGVYGPECIPHIGNQIKDEDFRAIGFHQHVKVGTLPITEVEGFGEPKTIFFNVNTSADLKEAEVLWRRHD